MQILDEQLRQQPPAQAPLQEASKKSPRRDFLRKSSTNRVTSTAEKPAKQYKYYADNFAHQAMPQSQSPKSVLPQALRQASAKKSAGAKSAQKPAQKQPKQNQHTIAQRSSPNAHQMRPQSQQIEARDAPAKSDTSSPPKLSRLSLEAAVAKSNEAKKEGIRAESASSQVLPHELQAEEEPQNLVSERNSVAEFEMLEQECIAKYL